jgi:hypothetical protein
VPPSTQAVELLRSLPPTSEYVFPHLAATASSSRPLLRLLQCAGYRDLTVHGFRSTFRVWFDECYPDGVARGKLAEFLRSPTGCLTRLRPPMPALPSWSSAGRSCRPGPTIAWG